MVTLESMKAHLRITETDEDALIAEKIAVASDWVSKYTGIPVDSPDVPPMVAEAVRQLAAQLYAVREASLIGVSTQIMPFGMLDLLDPYKKWAC